MRVLVTGASGNVGTALVRRLTAAGHQVVGVARRLPEPGSPFAEEVDWRAADLTDDASVRVLTDAMREVDAVVHLAWGFQPSHRPDYLEELGVGGTRRVVDAVRAAEVGHLVHMSSVGAYSPKQDDDRVDESWPTGGVPTSPYSRHKSAAERILDAFELEDTGTVVSRMRPGIVGQGDAGSGLLRYALPAVVPAAVLSFVPVLPLDRRLRVPMVHADDVADAFARVLERRAAGPFNLAAEPPVTTADIARVLSARSVQVPSGVVRAAVSASWHARLQPVDPGWVDLGFAVPLMDTTRAREELGWVPTHDAVSVLRETVEGMRHTRSRRTPVLRPRSVADQLGRFVREGPVSLRRRP
jgi:nucleoside-diphosphate-sugar epimerase